MKLSALVLARNEEQHLPYTLEALKNQTLPLNQIIVVNDGSTDQTRKIALQHGCQIIDLPFHRENYAGTPKIAELLNVGLRQVREALPDYIVQLGADHVLSSAYVETIVYRMEQDTNLVLVTGFIEGEPSDPGSPRGSGRVIKTSFFQHFCDLQYPETWCWEEWLPYKALQLGFKIRCFMDVSSTVTRATFGLRGNEGKTMYELGYHYTTVLGRCLLGFKVSPKNTVKILWDWLRHKGLRRMPLAKWVNQTQASQFNSRFFKFVNRFMGKILK